MSKNLEEDKEMIWHPFTQLQGAPDPIVVTEAKGIYLITEDGKKIMDGISSWWVNLHGHSHPAIAEALYQQAKTLEHVIFAGFTHRPAINLSKKLLSILPEGQAKIFFSDNGSTAVEVGIKMAIQYWSNIGQPRRRIVALEGAYHGDTFGAMSVGERGMFTAPFSDHLFNVEFIPRPDDANIDSVLLKFSQFLQDDSVAAFIFEPLVQAAAGMKMYTAHHLDKLLELATQKKVICIADEVFTGFGRTGKLFASDYLQHKPDIMALSKGLTGGTMALGITSCTKEIQDAFQSADSSKTFYHGHSFTGNPLGCAVACTSFDLLMDNSCQQRIQLIAESHKQFLKTIEAHPAILTARATGTILALELKTTDYADYNHQLKNVIYPYFLERGLLLRPLGNILYFLPSYAFTEDDLKIVYQLISKFLNQLSPA